MNDNNNLKKVKHFLITTVAAIVLTNMLTKIGELLSSWASKAGETILIYYLNHVCKSAAQANHDMLAMFLSIFLFGALCGGVLSLVRLTSKEAKDKTITDSRESVDAPGEDQEETLNNESNKRTSKMHVKTKVLTVILAALIVLVLGCWFTDYALPVQLLNQFEMDIKAITPYVEEADIRRLESQWVLMNDGYDYNEIQEFIRSVKEANNLGD